METLDAIAARRSIRRFRPDPVPDETITRLLEAARLAPSGSNAQPWAFVVVRDPDRRAALREAACGQRFVGEAPVVFVCCGNRKLFNKRLRRGKELVDLGAVDAETMATVGSAYRERLREAGAAEAAIRTNCCIAVEHLALAAADRGLGSCWVMLMDAAAVAQALDLPDHLFPVALLPVGAPAETPDPRPRYALADIAFDGDAGRPWGGGAS